MDRRQFIKNVLKLSGVVAIIPIMKHIKPKARYVPEKLTVRINGEEIPIVPNSFNYCGDGIVVRPVLQGKYFNKPIDLIA